MTSPRETAGLAAYDEQPVLQAVDVTKTFSIRGGFVGRSGTVHAAEGISLDLPRGSITAIVGESGCGKSTLSRVLAGINPPTSGRLLFKGREVPERRSAQRAHRRSVQLVLQDPFSSLNPVHTVRYVLSRPLRIHHHGGRDVGGLESEMRRLLTTVALEPPEQFLDKYPHELSGGQRQRVAVARALAVRPEVLVADEPVSMLDVSIRLGLLNLLAELREREGLTIVYVTHDIASARYLADTIVVMYAGRVIEAGPATEVTDNPQHPYTRLLIGSAPDPGRPRPEPVGDVGAPPSLVDPPAGCRFHPRCPFAMTVCRSSIPAMTAVGDDHSSACWLHEGAVPVGAPDRAPP